MEEEEGTRKVTLQPNGDDIEEVLAALPDEPLRELVSFNPVQVNYQLISLNIDTQQDLQLLLDNEQTLLQND